MYILRTAADLPVEGPYAKQWLYFSYLGCAAFCGRNLCIGPQQSICHLHPSVE